MAAEIMTAGIGTGTRFAPDDVPAVLEAASRYDVIAVGPGLGSGQEGLVAGLMEAWEGPLIIDADGLNAIEGPEALARRSSPTLITPHAGEFHRLTGSGRDVSERPGTGRSDRCGGAPERIADLRGR